MVQSPQPEGPCALSSLAMQLVAAAHTLLAQLRDAQSRFVVQPEPTAHCMHEEFTADVQLCAQLPPQSTPVSVPFLYVSVQTGG